MHQAAAAEPGTGGSGGVGLRGEQLGGAAPGDRAGGGDQGDDRLPALRDAELVTR